MRAKRLGLIATGALFSFVCIYELWNGSYVYAVGSAALALIYFWLGIRNVAKIDDNLAQSLTDLSDTLHED